jgi:hypothetical protein
LFEEAIMSQHWNEKAAERALQSPLKDYERRGVRFGRPHKLSAPQRAEENR